MAFVIAYMTGILLTLMISANGALSAGTNPYVANAVFQGLGLCLITLLVLIRHKRLILKWHPLFWLPGFLGALTVILNNHILTAIGITSMVVVGVLGQSVASIAIDTFGLLGKSPGRPRVTQWIGMAFMLIGILIMLV